MATVDALNEHYAQGEGAAARLLASIARGLEATGGSLESATVADLAPADEFHIGGRPATVELCDQLGLTESAQVLDVGSGIGGTARCIASTFGANVTGIDLNPAYVEVATELSRAVGLETLTSFQSGSATALPFDGDRFDIATQLHVGMNIPDKEALFLEVSRVLRPGGRFGVYDVMAQTGADISFPVPWASDSTMSHVVPPSTYRAAAEAAGLELISERNRSDFAAAAFATLQRQAEARSGPPSIGLHLVMGPDTAVKVQNMVKAVTAGTVAPVEMVWHKDSNAS